MAAYCPKCGTARAADARFCGSCGLDFAGGSVQANVASGLLELEQLRLKLIPFRLAGLVGGLALWWFVAAPALAGQFLPMLIALFALGGGGLYLGQIAGLSLVAGRR